MTKEKFLKVYNSYPPNFLTRWYYKHFSTNTKDQFTKNVFIFLFTSLVMIGILGTAFKLYGLTLFITILFILLFGSFMLLGFLAVVLNNIRIFIICKKLEITQKEYNELVDKFNLN